MALPESNSRPSVTRRIFRPRCETLVVTFSNDVQAHVQVEPGAAGPNTLELHFLTPTELDAMTISASLPEEDRAWTGLSAPAVVRARACARQLAPSHRSQAKTAWPPAPAATCGDVASWPAADRAMGSSNVAAAWVATAATTTSARSVVTKRMRRR